MKTFIQDESGASLVEYGLLVGLIAIAAIVALQAVGTSVSDLFSSVADKLGQAANEVDAVTIN